MPTLTTKIKGSNNYFSLISLNINGLNSPIKRHRLIDWLHKQDPTFCCLQETHLREKDRHYLRVKGWKTIFQANGLKKQAGVAILISDKIDFQPKVIKKDKEGHFILIKGKILQEELSITIDGETKVFHDKTKFTQYLSTNPALQRIITEKKQYKDGNHALEQPRK